MGCQINCCDSVEVKSKKKSLLKGGPQFELGLEYRGLRPTHRKTNSDSPKDILPKAEPGTIFDPHEEEKKQTSLNYMKRPGHA